MSTPPAAEHSQTKEPKMSTVSVSFSGDTTDLDGWIERLNRAMANPRLAAKAAALVEYAVRHAVADGSLFDIGQRGGDADVCVVFSAADAFKVLIISLEKPEIDYLYVGYAAKCLCSTFRATLENKSYEAICGEVA